MECRRAAVFYSLGKVEDYTPEQIQRMGIKLYELGGGEVKALLQGSIEELAQHNYGYVQVYGKAMRHYSLDALMNLLGRKHHLQNNLYNAVMLLLLERVCDPCSKRSNLLNQNKYVGLEPVLFCMMIDKQKHSIVYRVFKGDTFEGHTFENVQINSNNHIRLILLSLLTVSCYPGATLN